MKEMFDNGGFLCRQQAQNWNDCSVLINPMSGDPVDFDDLDICKTPHTVAALLKLYFRELPEPLVTFELYDCFIAANSMFCGDYTPTASKRNVTSFLTNRHQRAGS
jgi:hypothetical protein